jgi:hypothetical protein
LSDGWLKLENMPFPTLVGEASERLPNKLLKNPINVYQSVKAKLEQPMHEKEESKQSKAAETGKGEPRKGCKKL